MNSSDFDDEVLENASELGMHISKFHFKTNRFQIWKALITFEKSGDVFTASPFRPFKPHGLVIYNAPDMAVMRVSIMNEVVPQVSFVDVPVKFFNLNLSFEQIKNMLDKGEEPPAWCDWPKVNPGSKIDITVYDKTGIVSNDIQIVMWGHTLKEW